MRNRSFLVSIVLLLGFQSFGQSSFLLDSEWYAPGLENSVLSFSNANGRVQGVIVESENTAYHGHKAFDNLIWNDQEIRWEGEMQSPKSPVSLDVEIVYKDDNHFEIIGYFLFLKRTFILTRIDDEER